MRFVIVAAALLLVSASAQAQLTGPQVVLEGVRVHQEAVFAGMPVQAEVEVVLTCPHPGYYSLDAWVISLHAVATHPDLIVEPAQEYPVPNDYCLHPLMSSHGYPVGFDVRIYVPVSFNETGVYKVDLHLEAESASERADTVVTTFAFEVIEDQEMADKSAEMVQVHEEEARGGTFSEEAPGPALPLLAGGLALLARRQR